MRNLDHKMCVTQNVFKTMLRVLRLKGLLGKLEGGMGMQKVNECLIFYIERYYTVYIKFPKKRNTLILFLFLFCSNTAFATKIL